MSIEPNQNPSPRVDRPVVEPVAGEFGLQLADDLEGPAVDVNEGDGVPQGRYQATARAQGHASRPRTAWPGSRSGRADQSLA